MPIDYRRRRSEITFPTDGPFRTRATLGQPLVVSRRRSIRSSVCKRGGGMFRAACVIGLCVGAISTALAPGYPHKTIRVPIWHPPGGSAEAGARPLARVLEPLLGQPLVFEYRPGNAGGVAMEAM